MWFTKGVQMSSSRNEHNYNIIQNWLFLIEGDLDISRILTGVVREKKDYVEIKFPSLRIGLKKHYPFRLFPMPAFPEWVNQN